MQFDVGEAGPPAWGQQMGYKTALNQDKHNGGSCGHLGPPPHSSLPKGDKLAAAQLYPHHGPCISLHHDATLPPEDPPPCRPVEVANQDCSHRQHKVQAGKYALLV